MTTATYITPADTAKLVRKALAQAFPGVKFSVRSKSYSGGASVSVKWIDGPLTADVKAVAAQFAGASFDPMVDLKSYHTSELDGRPVRYGADYVFCDRDSSAEALEAAIVAAGERWGLGAEELPTIRTTSTGHAYLDGDVWVARANDYSTRLVYRLAQETAR